MEVFSISLFQENSSNQFYLEHRIQYFLLSASDKFNVHAMCADLPLVSVGSHAVCDVAKIEEETEEVSFSFSE